jgi:3D (Asp-Asp-Asp) domain-containing protein
MIRRRLLRIVTLTLTVWAALHVAFCVPEEYLPDLAPVETSWVFRPADPPPAKRLHVVVATAYCHCPICCGQWADGWTASGTRAANGRTLAADPAVFPMGTCLAFPDGPRVVEDTGSAIIGDRVDVYFDTHHEALQFGRQILALFSC